MVGGRILGLFRSSHYYAKQHSNKFYRNLFELEEVFELDRDFITLSKNILLKVLSFFGISGGLLYWFDETQNKFKLKTLHGISVDIISRVTKILYHEQGIIARLEQEPDGFIINQQTKEKWLKSPIELDQFVQAVGNMLVVPLKAENKMMGIMVLLQQDRKIRRECLNLLQFFLPRAAINLDNARLYQLTKETVSENARLYLNMSRLYLQATSDSLTGLYNRSFMMQRLKEEVKKAWRFGQPLSIVFADIDFFKTVNDSYGHQVGDILLTEFSNMIKKSIREYDVACRFGGEEFVIILPYTTPENACDLAERLRARIEDQSFEIFENQIKITASFGVSAMPQSQRSALPNNVEIEGIIDALIATADGALYQSKKNGRNQVNFLPYHSESKLKNYV